MTTKLIGIHGVARSGKDTLAKFFCDDHGFKRMAFADPVKRAAAIIYDWPQDRVFDDAFKLERDPFWGITVRDAFQKIGTEAGRDVLGEDHWVLRWWKEYRAMPRVNVVLTDVRFENEAEAIRAGGGLIVHLRRPGAGLQGPEAQHRSESGIDIHDDDFVLHNDGGLGALRGHACSVLTHMDANSIFTK